MSLEITTDDLFILEQLRLERFRSFFIKTLKRCSIHLDESNTLTIYCFEPQIVDQLLEQIEQLRRCVWIVLGVQYLSISFAQEEIYRTPTQMVSTSRLK
ncbi:hypothetical protein K9N68_14905 [Kovacikia minuta CCNUW1]|uniref:hypothetical protein n=1 Tax=Kovacikia minuta TaxID=2931930 RepID=UPI001CC9D253|nr:hypothetical protein [Kovacikia minuta]UBF29007.1 hypothetical protein K9N68_14905 [Kovacikia minuta CCNUW1]